MNRLTFVRLTSWLNFKLGTLCFFRYSLCNFNMSSYNCSSVYGEKLHCTCGAYSLSGKPLHRKGHWTHYIRICRDRRKRHTDIKSVIKLFYWGIVQRNILCTWRRYSIKKLNFEEKKVHKMKMVLSYKNENLKFS